MTTTTKALGVVAAAALVAAGIAGVRILNRASSGPPPPSDICGPPSGPGLYYYIDACGDWRVNWPGQGPNTDQGACAHARTAQDPSNGVRYYIVGQGAGGTRYPKPPATAIFALAEWNRCFVDKDTSGNFPSCLLPPVGGTQSPIMRTLSWPGIPKDKHDSWVAQFHCNVPTVVPPPTLTPTGFCTPRVVTVVVTATPKPAVTPAPVKTKPPVTPGTPGPKPSPQHTPPPEKTKVGWLRASVRLEPAPLSVYAPAGIGEIELDNGARLQISWAEDAGYIRSTGGIVARIPN